MWKPPEGAGEKWFCGDCGSAMFGSNPSHPEAIGIRMGTFDDDPCIRPAVRQFVAYAAVWEPLPHDGLPRFPESRHASGAPDLTVAGTLGALDRQRFREQDVVCVMARLVPRRAGTRAGDHLAGRRPLGRAAASARLWLIAHP